ncbi:MAG: hypothetical protein ACREP2_07505 [Rhodanobacteraceae bacterium]
MRPVVIRFGRLGDMLLLAPLLHRLRVGYGEACVLLGTGPFSAQLYATHPDVARVFQVTARHRPLALSPPRWQMLEVLHAHRRGPVHVCETEPRALGKIRRMLALAGTCRRANPNCPTPRKEALTRKLSIAVALFPASTGLASTK